MSVLYVTFLSKFKSFIRISYPEGLTVVRAYISILLPCGNVADGATRETLQHSEPFNLLNTPLASTESWFPRHTTVRVHVHRQPCLQPNDTDLTACPEVIRL